MRVGDMVSGGESGGGGGSGSVKGKTGVDRFNARISRTFMTHKHRHRISQRSKTMSHIYTHTKHAVHT